VTPQRKPIHHEGVRRALEKAERYRLLNDPFCAESICLDVLELEPTNQSALVTYILALSDQFGGGIGTGFERARAACRELKDEYERSYYAGIVYERRGYADVKGGGMKSETAWGYIDEAMHHYERAIAHSPPGNDDAILRWNTCVRLMETHGLTAPEHERHDYPLE
jgi:hypothetical protein